MTDVKIDIYFDGACRNVKGSTTEPFGVGVAVFIDEQYSDVYSKAIWGAEGTSNIAEWTGCVHACELADFLHGLVSGKYGPGEDIGNPIVTIYTDSQLIANQFNGEYEIRREEFKYYYNVSKERTAKFDKYLNLTWIPREKNWVADELSKRALAKNYSTKGANTPHIKSPRYRGDRFVGLEKPNIVT